MYPQPLTNRPSGRQAAGTGRVESSLMRLRQAAARSSDARCVTMRRCKCVAVVTLVVMLAYGCMADAQDPPPSPTPQVSITPRPESTAEARERADFEKADTAYRTNVKVLFELAAGDGKEAAKRLSATATGDYLAFQLKGLREAEKDGRRLTSPTNVVGTRFVSSNKDLVKMVACEDNSEVRILDMNGKDITPDRSRNYVQTLQVVRKSGAWRVSAATSMVVENFEDQAC